MKFRRHSFKARREFAVQDQLATHTPLYKETLPDFYLSLQERLSIQQEMLSLLQDALHKVTLMQRELNRIESKQNSLYTISSTVPHVDSSFLIEVNSIKTKALSFSDKETKTSLDFMTDVLNWQAKLLKKEMDLGNDLRDDVYKKLFLGV